MTGGATISVALCTCEGAAHLGEQLDSIGRQTSRPGEIIIGDDASNDATSEVIDAHRDLGVAVRVLDRPTARLGLRANLQRVLEETVGDLVALSDQDDVWAPHRLERGAAALSAEPGAYLVASDGWFIDASGRRQPGSILGGLGVGPLRRRRLRSRPVPVVVRRAVANGNTLLFRRRLLEAALPFPDELDDPRHPVHPDRWLTWVAAGRGPVVVLDDALVAYRRHRDQATNMEGGPTGRVRALARHERAGREARLDARDRLEARAAQLAEAARRTSSRDLDAAAAHLARRARFVGGPRRAAAVARELGRGGYRWSGPAAAAADLVRGGAR